ncbi:hypothetical protein SLL00_16590 [Metabacillus indicus]|uniref:hypothetical protein n=1 Tax=Metabacillus indicus TaxID=246786 RepID=UPI002A08F42B|nr:hypothetical protein [Metabacillus indicus]MDX8291430.1 hypothetical protein [Metabacillus indicus]
MILLDYLHVLFLFLISGVLFALLLKALSVNKNLMMSLMITILSLKFVISFPFEFYRFLRKNKSFLFEEVNKDKTLTKTDKRELKRIISSKNRLFIFILGFYFRNYRIICYKYLNLSVEMVKTNKKNSSTVLEETKNTLQKSLLKAVKGSLSEKLA